MPLVDEDGNPYKECPVEISQGFKCKGRVYVYHRVSSDQEKNKGRKPWVQCTEHMHCKYIRGYVKKDWELK